MQDDMDGYVLNTRSINQSLCQQRLYVLQRIIFKSLCKQRLHVLQKILNFFSYHYYSSSSSRQNLVRTSPPTVLMIQMCHLAHIFI